MEESQSGMARKIAEAIGASEIQTGSHLPKLITVVLTGHTMVVTLSGALSPIEHTLAQSPNGAAQLQEFHRHLFADRPDSLRHAINKITGANVCEAITEVEPASGTVVKVSTNGTVVHVLMLDGSVPADVWCGRGPCNEVSNG